MTKILIGILIVSTCFSFDAEARRRRKKSRIQVPANQIMNLEGTATVNGQPAQPFMGIKSGDQIETGENGVAVVRVAGLGIFRLKDNTLLHLKQVNDRNNSVIRIEKGRALIMYKRKGKHVFSSPKTSIKIEEPTTFFVTVNSNDNDLYCLCEGEVAANAPQLHAQGSPPPEVPAADAPSTWKAGPKHRILAFSGSIVEQRQPSSTLDGHSDKLIEDMAAIYALP